MRRLREARVIDFNALVAEKGVGPRASQATPQHSAWGYKPPVANSEDLKRILALPRRAQELDGTERAETIIDMLTERYARPIAKNCKCAALDPDRHRAEGCTTRLRLVQALALREIGICGGLLGPIGTGHGKTLLDLLAPLAFTEVGVKLCVLLIPVGLVGQLIGDYEYAGQHFRMPQIVFHGNSYANTCARMNSIVTLERDAPVVHVVPYSRLMLHEATTWLEHVLKPEAIISDECQKIRDIEKTATGARVARYMEARPTTRFAAWSGSITDKTIKDYSHLAKWSLRGGSPVPLDDEVVTDWCRALDPGDNPADPGPLLKLCAPGEKLLDGYRRRLVETLGVVTTTNPPVDCTLEINERQAPPIPDDVKAALKMVRGLLPGQSGPQRPDGEELVDALAMMRVAMQVACGFYYKWVYPRCVFPRDTQLVLNWLDARKEWYCEVREKLKGREEHLDSPLLCQYAAERAYGDRSTLRGLPTWKARNWMRWRDTRSTVYYETETVRLNDYLARDVAAWATENRGVVWYEHGAFGEWVAELSGLPLYGGGKDAKKALLGDVKSGMPGEDGSRSVICSIKAHGTGTNGLQHRFCKAMIPNPMSSPTGWEQVLARLVRIGQLSPIVQTWFFRHTPELKRHVDNALRNALYVESSLGAQQKIVAAFTLE